jgi:hypothetical protein
LSVREREGSEEQLCARERAGNGPKGGNAGARRMEGGRGVGRIRPSRGEESFSFFLFIFQFPFPFLFLFFLNNLFSR